MSVQYQLRDVNEGVRGRLIGYCFQGCCCRFCCGAPTTEERIHAPVLHDASGTKYLVALLPYYKIKSSWINIGKRKNNIFAGEDNIYRGGEVRVSPYSHAQRAKLSSALRRSHTGRLHLRHHTSQGAKRSSPSVCLMFDDDKFPCDGLRQINRHSTSNT